MMLHSEIISLGGCLSCQHGWNWIYMIIMLDWFFFWAKWNGSNKRYIRSNIKQTYSTDLRQKLVLLVCGHSLATIVLQFPSFCSRFFDVRTIQQLIYGGWERTLQKLFFPELSLAPYLLSLASYLLCLAPYLISMAPCLLSLAPYLLSLAPYLLSLAPYSRTYWVWPRVLLCLALYLLHVSLALHVLIKSGPVLIISGPVLFIYGAALSKSRLINRDGRPV
jgi:hypothetical protein